MLQLSTDVFANCASSFPSLTGGGGDDEY